MNVAFLANSFHLKRTGSANFFIQLLKDFFGEVSVIPHSEVWAELPKKKWGLIVVWQKRYSPEELEAFGAQRLVLVPMYDDTPLDEDYWSRYRDFKVLCFSSTMERLLALYGVPAWGIRYYPEPSARSAASFSSGLRGFFWPRTRSIDWSLVKKLVGDTKFAHLHLHWTPDVHGDLPPPLDEAERSDPSISVSSWFRDADEYLNMLASANVFFAPRRAEGIGMSFLEAMAMGLCVVAPRGPTMSEYIEDGVNGLLYDPDAPKPLDFSRAGELGAAARAASERGRLSWLDSLPALQAFLQEPVAGYRQRRHPLIAAKGRSLALARIVYRFAKRILRRALGQR